MRVFIFVLYRLLRVFNIVTVFNLQATLHWGKKDEPVYVTEESGVVGLNFQQTKEALAQDQSNGVNGKLAEMQMMEPQYDSSCCELTTRGKTKALLQKNFLRMWRNVG